MVWISDFGHRQMYILITVAWVSVGRNANKLLLLTNKVYLIRSYNNVNNHIACALHQSTNWVLYMQKNSGVMTNEQVCLVLYVLYFTLKYTIHVQMNILTFAGQPPPPPQQTKQKQRGGGEISLCECNFGLKVAAGRVLLQPQNIPQYSNTKFSMCVIYSAV